jgi:hypothetical protein
VSPELIGALIGFGAGVGATLLGSWWGFRRGIQVKHPELLKKAKPVGRVEFPNFNPSAR